MNEAAIMFFAIAIIGSTYFVLARRQFDFIALAFFGSCFYFMPGFAGYVAYPEGVLLQAKPVLPGTFVVMSLVQLSLLATAIATDALPTRSPRIPLRSERAPSSSIAIATVLAVSAAIATWVTVGSALTETHKYSLLDELNRWHLLWTTAATLGCVFSYQRSRWGFFAVNLLLLLLDLYVGFRVDLVVTLLTLMTLALIDSGPERLIRRWRLGLLVLILGLFMFVYKFAIVAIKLANWDLLAANIANPDAVRLVFFYSEPFIVQGILNEVIQQNFNVGMTHFNSIIYLIAPFSNELGADIVGFPELFQPALFPSVTDYGVGGNIWAEMLASGGWPLLTFAVGVYCLLLAAGSRIVGRLSGELPGVLAIVLVYWAFYIQRNDLIFQLTLTRRFILAGGAVLLASILSGAILRVWQDFGRETRRAATRGGA